MSPEERSALNNPPTVAPLSPEEARWVARLRRTLAACPPRLELLTIGDCYVDVIDGPQAKGRPLHDGHATRQGLVLATVHGPRVHGVSG